MSELEHISEKLKENQPKKNGGARPGAGRPKHSKNPKTIEREEALRQFKERVAQNTDRLFNAQLNLAVGEQVLMVKYTTGEGKNKKTIHEQVTDVETIKEFLDYGDGSPTTLGDEENWYYLTTRSANNQAIDSLLNRSFGKADEKIDITSKGESIKTPYNKDLADKFEQFMLNDTRSV